jgi:PAS domain S-box-containing protein
MTGSDVQAVTDGSASITPDPERIRELFENSPIAAYATDAQGRLIYFNSAAAKLAGRMPQLGTDQWSVAWKLYYPDGLRLPPEKCPLALSLSCGQSVGGGEYIAERPDGSRFWFTPFPTILRDLSGQIAGAINVLIDITPKKAAQQAGEEQFHVIFESTPECVKLVSADGTILRMNTSGLGMVGAFSGREVIGRSVYDLIAPEDREAFRELNQRVCAGEKDSLEFDILGLDGERRHVETHAVPLRYDGATVQLAVTRDLTARKQVERATLLLSAIVDSSDDAIVSKDLNGVITSWNKSAERLFGHTAAEAIGQPVASLIIPHDRQDEERNILQRLRKGERVDHFETIRKRKDETLLDISLTISPVRDSSGRVIGASKIARDISDRKRAQRAIQSLNEHLSLDLAAMTRMQQLSTRLLQGDTLPQLLAEIASAGVEIAGAAKGTIHLLEDGVLTIVAQQGFSKPFVESFDANRHNEAPYHMALLSSRRVIVEDIRSSPFYSETAGRAMLEAGALASQSTPLLSRTGEALGVFSTYYSSTRQVSDREMRLLDVLSRQAADLIERTRAEQALLASEGRFRQLADSMPQIVWTARPDGYVDYYNERWYEFTGTARNLFGDESWKAVLHPEDVQRCHDHWYESVGAGTPYQFECRFWDRRDKRWRWFMSRALAVRDRVGRVVKWFGSSTEIDDQKQVEDELRRANFDLEQFAYSATHDLQEPLRSVKIYSELLAQHYSGVLDARGLEFLEYLRTGATRMAALVQDLLAYTQVAKADESNELADANEALSSTLSNLKLAITEAGAQVTSDPLPTVPIHATHLQQLFQNLIGNAVKYRSPERAPSVHVGAELHNGYCLFTVSDNGIGIDPQYKEEIFGLFKRLHTSDKYSGTGIGLALCQRIVDRYRGRIWVESQPGRGSIFRFAIPI